MLDLWFVKRWRRIAVVTWPIWDCLVFSVNIRSGNASNFSLTSHGMTWSTIPRGRLFALRFGVYKQPYSPANGSMQLTPHVLGIALQHVELTCIWKERDQVVKTTRQVATEGVRDFCCRPCQPECPGSQKAGLTVWA